jgi:hypothetical protein
MAIVGNEPVKVEVRRVTDVAQVSDEPIRPLEEGVVGGEGRSSNQQDQTRRKRIRDESLGTHDDFSFVCTVCPRNEGGWPQYLPVSVSRNDANCSVAGGA